MDIPQKQIKGKLIQIYSDEFKRAVCEEYLNGTASKMDIQRKYRICYKSAIVWNDNTQYVYTYDGMNDMLTNLVQTWSGSAWVNYTLATYSNFVAKNPQTEIDQTWNTTTSAFVNSTMYTNTYNSFNQETETVSETWNVGGFWQYTTSDYEDRYYYQTFSTSANTLINNGSTINIYPVPTKDNLNIDIKWDSPQPFDVAIFDMQGVVLYQWQVPYCSTYKTDIALTWLPEGNYFIRVNGANSSFGKQFIIIR